MTINPGNLRPLTELTYLSQTKQLFDHGELKYYNITARGPQEKGFLGKVWAWLLDVFGLKTNLSTYVHAVNKYSETIPENIASLASRLVVSRIDDRTMAQVNQIAQSILNDGFDLPAIRALETATNYESLKELLEGVHAEVDIPEDVDHLENPIEKYFKFIHERKRSKGYLLETFEKDCSRMTFSIFDERLEAKKDISIWSESFKAYCHDNELEETPINHKAFVEEQIKQAFASDSLRLGSQELADRLTDIEMFSNQTTGNDLFLINPHYSPDINKKVPISLLADEENVDLASAETRAEYAPLRTKFLDPTVDVDANFESIRYKGSWNIYEGDDEENTIAKVKCVAGINFITKNLVIVPVKKFTVSESATITQMQRLAARFLR